MRVTLVGTGYVGLVSGACFAEFGHSVSCVDLDEKKIAGLKRNEMPIYEPGLRQLVEENSAAGRLQFTTDLKSAVAEADIVFVAVGTPPRGADGHTDLAHVYAAAASIAEALVGFTVIATKSTVPVGTGDEIERIVRAVNPAADVVVVSNPEFLREGSAIEDFKFPDRIVIGISDERAKATMTELYRPFQLSSGPLFFTTRRTSELIKYAANAFLAMKITFINEIADLCEKTGADVQDVAHGVGLDERIGRKFFNAGPGFGGSCFPKDTLALAKIGQDHDAPQRLVETTVSVNEQRKRAMGRKVVAACGGTVHGKTIAVLGLTFKPNTDDMRDSPALSIVQSLLDGGATIRAFDPEGMAVARRLMPRITYCESTYAAAQDADCLVVVTEWNQFRSLDFAQLKGIMKVPLLVDLRNIYREHEVLAEGFAYVSIGRPPGSSLPIAE